jgi:SnoaL-like protein
VVDLAAVQGLLAGWWFDYDQGNFPAWPDYFTADAHFACRSDSGKAPYEDFIRADVTGRDEVLAWQEDHRRNSPYPLRHNATNVHLVATRSGEADFRSYIFVTQIVGGTVSNLSTGLCLGTARAEAGSVRLAQLQVVLDTTDSEMFSEVDGPSGSRIGSDCHRGCTCGSGP